MSQKAVGARKKTAGIYPSCPKHSTSNIVLGYAYGAARWMCNYITVTALKKGFKMVSCQRIISPVPSTWEKKKYPKEPPPMFGD